MMLSKNYYLVIQLGSYEKNSNVFNLLKFPYSTIFTEEYNITTHIWSRGSARTKKHQDVNKHRAYLSKLKEKTFNTLDIKISMDPYPVNIFNMEIRLFFNELLISPMNCLWENVYGYKLDKPKADKMRSQLETKERSLRWNRLTRYPTLLLTVAEVKSNSKIDQLKKDIVKLVSTILNKDIKELDFGCIDLLDRPPALNLLQYLAPYPKTCQCLDEKFDDIHDIFIGKTELCEMLFNYLKGKSEQVRIDKLTDKCSILYSYERDKSIISECSECFVTKDQSTAPYEPRPEKGEYRIGNITYFTYRRYMELIEKKLLPIISDDDIFHYFKIISDKFIPELNIDSNDVLVVPKQKAIFKGFYDEIGYNYEKLTDIKDNKKRIWLAHEQAYKNPRYSLKNMKKMIDKIKELYFGDI